MMNQKLTIGGLLMAAFWALVARFTGTRCPALVLLMPSACSVNAHLVGCGCPCDGHGGTR